MKKSTLIMMLALLLAVALGIGGTMAYLQDTDEDVNVMTLGKVDIVQLENDLADGGFENGQPLYPAYYEGEEIDWESNPGVVDKKVNAENVGASDAYVRTWFAFEAGEMSWEEFEANILLNLNDGEDSSWEWTWDKTKAYSIENENGEVSNYYIAIATLKEALPVGEITDASLLDVAMSKAATNEIVEAMGEYYTVLVKTQAMQTAGFEENGAAVALAVGFKDAEVENGAIGVNHPWGEGFEQNYPVQAAKVHNTEELLAAIDEAEEGDVITVAPGTYPLQNMLVLDKGITIQGTDSGNKPVLVLTASDGTGDNKVISHGVEIKADNVTLSGLSFKVETGMIGTGNMVQISSKGTDYYSDITIENCEFAGGDHCIALYGNNVTIKNCILDESQAHEQGNVIYVWGTSGDLVIQNNRFVGKAMRKHGVSFYHQSADSAVSGNILIDGNTFEDIYKAIVHESNMVYTDVSVTISNNTVTNCSKKPVAIDNGSYLSYVVTGNVFNTMMNENCVIDNKVNTAITANGNYWGSESPVWSEVISGSNVTVENYYADSAKTDLRTK